jgi:CRP/FNR family cyclic AMP-dependent transcriptional regulator
VSTTVDYLKQVRLFADLSESQRERIAAACRRKVFRGRVHLFCEGDPGSQLYIVMRGGVKIFHDAESTGQETTLALLAEGDFFGEMALLIGGERTASAITIAEETELLMLDQASFYAVLKDSVELATVLLRNLAIRLKQTNTNLVAMASDTSLARVAKLLLARADVASGRLCPPLTQEEMAHLIGMRRETVARNLRGLESIHVLKRNRGHIVVTNRAALEKVACSG